MVQYFLCWSHSCVWMFLFSGLEGQNPDVIDYKKTSKFLDCILFYIIFWPLYVSMHFM